MKTLRINQLFAILIFLASGIFINACSPDSESENIAPQLSSESIISPCETCEYQYFYKSVGNDKEVVGTVTICQDSENLILTYTVSDDRDHAWFKISGYRIYADIPTSINPGDLENKDGALASKETIKDNTERSIEYIIPLSELGIEGIVGSEIYIATYVVVPGPDGSGGMVWAGGLKPTKRNPNSRFFAYTIKDCQTPEPPTENCTFTQGYWFAKPNGSQWPSGYNILGIEFGGQTYTYLEAQSIFFGKNNKTGKTIAKQAFLQGLALKLSIAGGADLSEGEGACEGILNDLAKIEAYFTSINMEVTADEINTDKFNKEKSGGVTLQELSTAANNISACLNQNHCDNTPS